MLELTNDPVGTSPTLSEASGPENKRELVDVPGDLLLSEELVLGQARRSSEMRSIGGMLLILGAGAVHSALALTAVGVEGMGGKEHVQDLRLAMLLGTILQTVLGMAAMVIGFYTLLVCPTNKAALYCARVLIVAVNSGPVALVCSMVRIAMGARGHPSTNIFIPTALNPSQTDIRVVAFYGICALFSVCATLLGGLNLLTCNLCAFLQGPNCLSRNRKFYKIRFVYYCILVIIGGVSQFGLGIYTATQFGHGPFEDAIHVSVFTIYFPSLAIVVGGVQLVVGVFGFGLSIGWFKMDDANDIRFQVASLASWIVTMVLQIIAQPSYASEDMYDAEGATYASVYLGFFLLPVWLAHHVRNTSEVVPPERFGFSPDTMPEQCVLVKIFYPSTAGQNVTYARDLSASEDILDGSVQSSRTVL